MSCDGRVVKAFDSKSNGIFPRRFESYSQREKRYFFAKLFQNNLMLRYTVRIISKNNTLIPNQKKVSKTNYRDLNVSTAADLTALRICFVLQTQRELWSAGIAV